MAEVRHLLLDTLNKLTADDFKQFKWFLRNNAEIPQNKLEAADRMETVDLLVQFFPQEAQNVAIQTLRGIFRNDLVQHLSLNNPGGKGGSELWKHITVTEPETCFSFCQSKVKVTAAVTTSTDHL